MAKISDKELKKYIINAQLLRQESNVKGVIDNLGYVQIDTIHVTERAHHHVLWSRFSDYNSDMLTELHAGNQVFEYWSHAASILPIESFRYSLLRKRNFAWHNEITDTKEFHLLLGKVYKRIYAEGALSSSDFDDKNLAPGEMWSWKMSRYALEYLLHQGKLMVARRIKFRKVYDLTQRVYPESEHITCPPVKEAAEYQVSQALSALGAATEREIYGYLSLVDRVNIKNVLADYTKQRRIREFENRGQVYYSAESQPKMIDYPDKVFILSPFDNLIINRKRIFEIFGFDYKLECYVPKVKRKYGFFSMPLLYQDRFIGLMDAKADRKSQVLQINNLHISEALSPYEEKLLFRAIEDFASFNNCHSIELIRRSSGAISARQHVKG
ncbi:MAG: winged helix DNA-binding domain-containing protein [Candidatus Cloacimonetes bacterium]|nr:winged helix DNA-binding domain-containing protein [Candidatus Cloacimonadota bacterium]